jgi:hypothetical protein
MSFTGLDRMERAALLVSLGLVAVVFAAATYGYLNPPTQVWEARVFQVFHEGGNTVVYSYGEGKLKITGDYDIEPGETIRVTFRTHSRNAAEFDITVEKIG